MSAAIIGWDIGGANIKAARLERSGTGTDRSLGTIVTRERPFALWRDPDKLPEVLEDIFGELGGLRDAARMGLTMTAELADCFASKREGVACILDAFDTAFPALEPQVWGVDGRFHSPAAARSDPHRVAAANWAATAHRLARLRPDALLVDVGSTTTDIMPIVGGRVAARGRTDPERLRSGELVYTGMLRTPVCAVVRRVRLAAGWCRVAAEAFAIAGDAHLWLGDIAPGDYTCETPDGRGVGRTEVAARLAHVVCADPEMLAPGDLGRIARQVADAQRRQIAAAIRQVVRRMGNDAPRTALIAGSGAFLGEAAAANAGLEPCDLADELGSAAARAAPAASIAWLLAEQEGR